MSVWLLAQMMGNILFGHRPPSVMGCLIVPFMAGLFAALIFASWSALFRFSDAVVRPCVFMITMVLLSAALKAQSTYVQPMVERDVHRTVGSIMPFVALLISFLGIVATIKFYRLTSALIVRLLYS